MQRQRKKKTGIVPDAIATHPDGATIAIEVERTVKSVTRYSKIVTAHLGALKYHRWNKVYYLCPDPKVANRLRKIFGEISEVEFAGKMVPVPENFRSLFVIYLYDDDWT